MTIASVSRLWKNSGSFSGAAHHVTEATITGTTSQRPALTSAAPGGTPRRVAATPSSTAAITAHASSSQTVPGTLPICSNASVNAP